MVAHDENDPLLDRAGRTRFSCGVCRAALSASDLAELGLRLPDQDETIEAYCDAELLDPRELYHPACREREAAAALFS